MPRYTGLLPALLVKAIKYLLVQLSTLESKIDLALKFIDGALRQGQGRLLCFLHRSLGQLA